MVHIIFFFAPAFFILFYRFLIFSRIICLIFSLSVYFLWFGKPLEWTIQKVLISIKWFLPLKVVWWLKCGKKKRGSERKQYECFERCDMDDSLIFFHIFASSYFNLCLLSDFHWNFIYFTPIIHVHVRVLHALYLFNSRASINWNGFILFIADSIAHN